jgi:hypothetical protein
MGGLNKIRWGEGKLTKIGLSYLGLGQVNLSNKRVWIWRLRLLGKC